MSKKRPRRVGLGMKPRKDVAVQGVEPLHPPVAAVEVSGTAVQPEVPLEAVPEGVEGEQKGGRQELTGVQILDPEPEMEVVLGENEPIVAQNPVLEPPPAVPQTVFDDLNRMMEESRRVTGADPQFTANMITFEEAAKMGLPPVEGADGYVIGIDVGIGKSRTEIDPRNYYQIPAEDKTQVKLTETGAIKLGELPNGEYRATVRVGEGYIEGIKAQAEADGQSLEDWLTFQLQERLEQWFFAKGSR